VKRSILYSIIVGAVFCLLNFSFLRTRNETTDLYLKCLKTYIQRSENDNIGPLPDTINILDNAVVDLPPNMGRYKLRIINDTIISDFIQSQTTSTTILKIFPITVDDDEELEIDFVDYITSKYKKRIILDYTGRFAFYFKFNCRENKYTLINFKVSSL
jgi:hypothetical protein